LNTANLVKVLGKTNFYLIQKVAGKMLGHIQDGKKPRDVWDFGAGIDLAEIGRMHAIFELLSLFVDQINKEQDSPNKTALVNLACL
jgi:hypothetical protein